MIRRVRELTRSITAQADQLAGLVAQAAPQLLAEPGFGVLLAAKFIGEIAGIDRFQSDAQPARLPGCAPVHRRLRRHRPPPPGYLRQPTAQPRLPHARDHQAPPRPPNRPLPRQTARCWQDQQRRNPQRQTPPRPTDLPPSPRPRQRSNDACLVRSLRGSRSLATAARRPLMYVGASAATSREAPPSRPDTCIDVIPVLAGDVLDPV